jgi:Txe/YoeB family toxin of toxin-antitoxin system
MYSVEMSNQAEKDHEYVVRGGLSRKLSEILRTVEEAPFRPTQRFERLSDNLKGLCSRRLNQQHRFVYEVLPNDDGLRHPETGELYDGIVFVVSMWGHPY